MSDVTIRDESKHWRVIAVPNPTNGAEIYKAMQAAELEYERIHDHPNEWDETFEVSANEEEIMVRFEIKEKDR